MTLDSFLTVYTRYGKAIPNGRWPYKYVPVSDAEKEEAKTLVTEYAKNVGLSAYETRVYSSIRVSLFPKKGCCATALTTAPNGESPLDAWTFALCEIAFCTGIKTLDELKVMLDIGGSYAKRAY